MNYPGSANKHINNFASGSGKMLDAEGNYYYVSHPPLAYYIPYAFFKLFQIKPSVIGIQLFHTLFHYLSALGVFMIINLLTGRWPLASFSATAFIGYLFYLFNAATLWFQSNTYMSDMMVQTFFIFGALFALLYARSRHWKWLIAIFITIFLMIYTTWLGLFFAFVVFIVSLVQWKDLKLLSLLMPTVVALALGLIFYQYSQINGWEAYWAELTHRFEVRGIQVATSFFSQLISILQNYATSYLPLFVLFIYLTYRCRSSSTLWRLLFETPYLKMFMAITLLPILLLHVALPNYSGHDFTTLYAALPLSVVLALLAIQARPDIKWLKHIPLVVIMTVCLFQYYYFNRPGEHSWKGDRYAEMREQGELIATESSVNAVIFLIGEKPTPEMVYYAHRNIQRVRSEEEAITFLEDFGRSQGVLFRINEKRQAEKLKSISL